jgi:hypothetical protein
MGEDRKGYIFFGEFGEIERFRKRIETLGEFNE